MVIVPGQVLGVNEEVMVSVQLPEFTVNDIEVLIGEIICNLIDVILFFQQGECLVGQQEWLLMKTSLRVWKIEFEIWWHLTVFTWRKLLLLSSVMLILPVQERLTV